MKKQFFVFVALTLTLSTGLGNPTAQQSGASLTPVGSLPLGAVSAVFVRDHYAYASVGPMLVLFDVTVPTAPKMVGLTESQTSVEEMFVQGDYAYVLGLEQGLEVFDVSDPTHPEKVGGYGDLGGDRLSGSISGAYAYLGDESGLSIVEITDPTNLALRGFYPTSEHVGSVYVRGERAYVSTGKAQSSTHSKLLILDISMASDPTLLGTASVGVGRYGLSFLLDAAGQHAYLTGGDASGYDALWVMDMTDPDSPTEIGHYPLAELVSDPGLQLIFDSCLEGDVLYLSGRDQLWILDVSDPAAPEEIASYPSSGRLFVSGEYGYLAHCSGVSVIAISKPSAPQRVAEWPIGGDVDAVDVSGAYAYVAAGRAGLVIYEVSNPRAPVLVGQYTGGVLGGGFDRIKDIYKVSLSGKYAYLADKGNILRVVDISDPGHPVGIAALELERENESEIIVSLVVLGSYTYITHGELLTVVNVSDPAHPVLLGTCRVGESPFEALINLCISGGRAYGIGSRWGGNNLRIWDVSDPLNMRKLGEYGEMVLDVCVEGNYAYLSTPEGLEILNVSDPAHLLRKGTFYPENVLQKYSGVLCGVSVSGGYAHLRRGVVGANEEKANQLMVVDISDPAHPREVARSNLHYVGGGFSACGSARPCVSGAYVYVPLYSDGLQILRLDRPTGIREMGVLEATPERFYLSQNIPNPFNSSTVIAFEIAWRTKVVLDVYNTLGQKVKTLAGGLKEPGRYAVTWDGRDDAGSPVASGIYIIKVEAGNFTDANSMLLLR